MDQQVKVGDVFRCKRRGHEVVVRETDGVNYVYYHDSKSRRRRVPVSRLLDRSRFTFLSVAPAPEPQTVA